MKFPRIRQVTIGFLLLDALVIGAAAVEVDDVVARTTTAQAAGVPAPAALPVDGRAPDAIPAEPVDSLLGAVPLGDGGLPLAGGRAGGGVPSGTGDPSPSGDKGSAPARPTETPDEGEDPAGRGIPPCPIKLSDAPQSGGLQSLVPFAPAFGPFSAEAFAFAAAYQPELQLLGPILAQYPSIEPVVAPILTPVISSLGKLLANGLDTITPLYGPHRTQFLEAETELAAALAPYSQALAHNELGGCIVELQSALLAASRSGVPGVPSPTTLGESHLGLGGLL